MNKDTIDIEFSELYKQEDFNECDLVAITSLEDAPWCPACSAPTVLLDNRVHCPDCARAH